MIDPHLFHATLETGYVTQMPILVGLLGRILWQTAQKQGRRQFQIVLWPLIDDGPGEAVVDAQREILLDRQQFDNVILAVGDHFEAVHRRYGMIANVVADTDASIEHFHRQMLHVAVVQQNAILLRAAEHDGHVRLGLRAQRFHFDERIVVHKTDAGQIFAPFARIAGHTFAHVIRGLWIWLEADAMFALVVLARRRLRIHHGHHWGALAEFARIFFRAFARVIVDAVHTGAPILAHVILAIVDIL